MNGLSPGLLWILSHFFDPMWMSVVGQERGYIDFIVHVQSRETNINTIHNVLDVRLLAISGVLSLLILCGHPNLKRHLCQTLLFLSSSISSYFLVS